MSQRQMVRVLSAHATTKISRRAFRGCLFCFSRAVTTMQAGVEFGRVCAARQTISYSESQQRALLSPVSGQSRSVAHQLFGAEVVRLTTVDNCRGDVGCKPGQPYESIDVSGGH